MSRISRKKKRVADHDIKLLLNETIRHLGKVGDVVKVKPGYARNYLIPRGLAISPTPKNLERIESKRKDYEKYEASLRQDQQALLAKLENHEVKLVRRANERGNLYGSAGASDIAHALNEADLATHNSATITADEINLARQDRRRWSVRGGRSLHGRADPRDRRRRRGRRREPRSDRGVPQRAA